MRIGSMVRQLLDEVKSAPLDQAGRAATARHPRASRSRSCRTVSTPSWSTSSERLSLPLIEGASPSESELRVAQAQLVGWLEGLFHGIQVAMYAQQVSARAQFEQMRRALPGAQGRPAHGGPEQPQEPGTGQSGMYL